MNKDQLISAVTDSEASTGLGSLGLSWNTGTVVQSLLVAGGLAAAHGAAAQVPAAPEGEVVELDETALQAEKPKEVSSPKFTAPLIDTPQTVSVIPSQVFHEQGARNLTDVLKNTPGITFNAGENGFVSGPSNFSMRGFDSSGSVYVDGFRDSGNYLRDTYNVEQVEVIKGPAADNGRGTAGGYVNVVTKTPQLGQFVRGTASFGFDGEGSKERYRGTLDVNQPLDETIGFRLNGLWENGGVPGRKVAKNRTWAVAPSITLGLGTDTRYTLAYSHLDQDNIPDFGVPGAFIKKMKAYDPNINGKGMRNNFYGLKSDFDKVKSDAVTFRVEHDFSAETQISNQTRWSDTKREAHFTVPFGYDPATRTVTTQRQAFDRKNTLLANQTNLQHKFETGSLQHTLTTGLELSREESKANRYGTQNDPGTGAPISVYSPDANRAGPWNIAATQNNKVKIDTIAVYAYDTVELSEDWILSGGLRFEHYDLELRSRTAAGAPTGINYKTSESTLGGKIGLVYKVAPNGSIYVTAGLSALPPGAFLSNPDISRTGDNAFPGAGAGMNSKGSKVQEALNLEVGTKWEFFEGRLGTSLALFHTERRNVAMGDGFGTRLLGYGKQIVQGAELGVTGKITDEWSVFGGLLLMDSERKHSSAIDAQLRHGPVNGDQLAFTPHVTANLWTTYQLPIEGLSIGGGARYVGSSYLGRPDDAERIIPNGSAGKLPSYWVFDAMVSYDINENFTVRFYVENLADRFYATSANWPGTRVAVGAPRTFTLSADIRF